MPTQAELPKAAASEPEASKRPVHTVTAGEMMTSPVVTVEPETSIAQVAKVLADKHISAVVVCKHDGTLAGMLSEGDILHPFRESMRQKRDWWLGVMSEGENLSQEFLDYVRVDTRSAADLMVRHVVTATEDATLPELAELICKHRVRRIPILRDGRVVGIVSRGDLIRALAGAPGMLI
ncbi:MAG TPA: CBS domain-containing protein [Acidisphaera sp.]|nr:CBS domain-containing protein [Acidisphaera sp.]